MGAVYDATTEAIREKNVGVRANNSFRISESTCGLAWPSDPPVVSAATGKVAEGESSASRGSRGKASKQRRRKLNRWETVQSDEYLKEAELLGHSVPKLNQQIDRSCD